MSNSLYFSNLDPNRSILPVLDFRRNYLFQLLIWDSIVISDSQFLTDPRIHILMNGCDSHDLASQLSLSDPKEDFKGFEKLIENGLVEVAFRKDGETTFGTIQLWENMNASTNRVPFLPASRDYAEYLSELSTTSRVYDLSKISARFKSNLLSGVESSLKPSCDAEFGLVDMFNSDPVLFRDLKKYIDDLLHNETITQERYEQIYNYIYSCYSINISAETNCHISSKLEHIPFHLESGTGDFEEKVNQDELKDMCSTWGLNPAVLDLITIDEFIELRKRLDVFFKDGLIAQYYSGTLNRKDVDKFIIEWEKYIVCLETTLELMLRDAKKRLTDKYGKVHFSFDKIFKPFQIIHESDNWELVSSYIGLAPVIGTILDYADAGLQTIEMGVNLSRRHELKDIKKDLASVEALINGNTKIITKY